MSEPIYELALDPKIIKRAEQKLERTKAFDNLRELIDFLLENWVRE